MHSLFKRVLFMLFHNQYTCNVTSVNSILDIIVSTCNFFTNSYKKITGTLFHLNMLVFVHTLLLIKYKKITRQSESMSNMSFSRQLSVSTSNTKVKYNHTITKCDQPYSELCHCIQPCTCVYM